MLGITAFTLVFIVVVICAIAALSRTGGSSIEIELPEPRDAATGGDAGEERHGLRLVEVTADNVREVIASLERPSAYSRDIMVESFWDGGNSVHNFSVSAMAGATALRTSSGGAEKNIIVTSSRVYVWYTGDEAAFSPEAGGGSADEYQMIPTYEDVLALPRSAIIDAGYTNGGGEIYVQYTSGTLGYVTLCRVSARLGLLISSEIYDGETLIYRMTAGDCRVGEPDPRLFRLPDGENALDA
ncbi:MAG: hypothetical protein LBH17_08345 [Oscillospiraceae bacterium]|jgi:hypothetical protein|nr:hypothetical protein [Oscillospiraceae bacterium]